MAPITPSRRSIAPTRDLGPGFRSAQKVIFCNEGAHWIIGYSGNTLRLKSTRGLGYVAHLLRHPGAEFHALDLYGGISSVRGEDATARSVAGFALADDPEKARVQTGGLADAGEMIDEQTKIAYRRQLSELREELDKAKELGTVERAEKAEAEIDALTRELSRAVRLGGRNSPAASASERARQSVTKSIKSALAAIAQREAALGELLSRCIKTGNVCTYRPDPDFPVTWEFADTIAGQSRQPVSSGDQLIANSDHSQTLSVVLNAAPLLLAKRTTLVGRESECEALHAVIDRALNGRGLLVMLAGGSGVGKTRLAMEMMEYASRAGFKCLVGHCYERDELFPYLPFVEIIESTLAQAGSLSDFRRLLGDNAAELAQLAPILRRVFPDIPQLPELPPAQKRRFLFQGFSEALARAARTRSYMLILEDLHWADESSLALLIHLSQRISQLPVVIVATYRDDYSDINPQLLRTLEELIRISIRPLKVGGLSRRAVGQMLNELTKRQVPQRLVDIIFDESQGNPFFVEELYRYLLEEGTMFDADGQLRSDLTIQENDVPESVRLVIGRRLGRLNEAEKRVLAAAAVIGRSFSFQLLSEISQLDVDELFAIVEKAQQMGIIVSSAEGSERPLTFGHELVRQTLITGIAIPRQQRLHAIAADAIERIGPGPVEERAGAIADHLLKAGPFADSRKLVRWLTRAGENALEAAAFEEALCSFQSALSHQDAVSLEDKARLLTSVAMAERGLERWDAALINLRKALEINVDLDNREMSGKSFIELTDALFWAGRFREAAETARKGLAHLQKDVSADRVRLLADLGQGLAEAGAYEPAHEALQEALSIASRLSDSQLAPRVFGARSVVNFHFLRLNEATADGFLNLQSGGSEGTPWQRAVQLRVLRQTLLYLGRLDEAARIADQLEPLARKIGQSYSVAVCLGTRAWTEFGRAPELTKLEASLREIPTSSEMAWFNYWEALFEAQLSLVDFFRGDWATALSHAQASCGSEPEISIQGVGIGMLFRHMAYADDRDRALAILGEKRTWLPAGGQPTIRGSWLMLALVVEGLAMLGEQSQAGQLYPRVRELVDTGAVALWPIYRFTHTIAGIAAGAAREWDAAEEHFRTALKQAESFPQRLEAAEILRFHAMMLKDRGAPGDRERARQMIAKALDTYLQIGMSRHIEITRTLLD
jgi:tetratricopeptide (TPR) repeat protein